MSMKPPAIFVLLLGGTMLPAIGIAEIAVEGSVALPKILNVPVANARYELVSDAGVLKTDPPRAVVYLEGKFPRPGTLPVKQMEHKDLTHIPELLPVELGTKVEFPKLDDVYHNIFSYSPAKRVELGRDPPNEKPIPFQNFDRPGLVTVRCDIHEHMRALI